MLSEAAEAGGSSEGALPTGDSGVQGALQGQGCGAARLLVLLVTCHIRGPRQETPWRTHIALKREEQLFDSSVHFNSEHHRVDL